MDYSNILKNIVKGAMGATSLDNSKISRGISDAIPQILEQLNLNTQNNTQREQLNRALIDHENDDIDDAKNYIKNFDADESKRMVDKIFGDRRQEVEENLKKKTGFSDADVKKLLMIAAPLVIAHLAKSKKNKGLEAEDLMDETKSFKESSGVLSTLRNLLDRDNDGKIIDEIFKIK